MAMLISKFNKLIRSRLLWGAFLIVIVFSFVVWGMVWPSDLDRAEQANAAGTLDGETVSPAEFAAAYRSTYLARALALGRDIGATPETEAILRQMSWLRLATLREAAKLGIGAADDELRNVLRANFAETNGAYNPQRYQAFLQNVIVPLGASPTQFEQHLREEIAIQKLGQLIGRQAQVTPLEIRRTFETLLDEFQVDYALLRESDVAKDVEVTEADARRLYETDPAAFTRPEQCEVSYAAFPIAAYADEQAEFTEDEIQDYYELHIEDYTTEEPAADGTTRETIATLDDVRDGIVAALRRQAAQERADAAATELAFRAIPDRDGTVPDFAAEAAKSGYPAQKLPPFARGDVPVEDGGAAFAAAAFELEPNAFDRVSAPVAGETHVYVIYLERKIAPRVPSFEEAQEDVLAIARRKAVADALALQAEAVRKAAADGLTAGKTFAAAVKDLGVETASAEPFTGLSGSSSTNPVIQALVQAVVSHNPGEVTEPVAAEDGLIVAYLKARTPADPATYDTYQGEIASTIRLRRGQGRFREWQAALLAPERFTDLQQAATDAADEIEEDGVEDTDAPPAADGDEDLQYLM